MATASVPNNFTDGEAAVADDVDANFQALVDHMNNYLVQADGSVPFTGAVTLSGDPTTANHAVRKAYVDALITTGAWTSYTPTWSAASSSTSVGNGTLIGRYSLLNTKTVAFNISLLFGSSTNGGRGAYTFTLPFAAVTRSGEEQTVTAKAFTNGNLNYVGYGLIGSGGSVVQPYFPVSASASNLAPAQNTDSAGGVGAGVPPVFGGYTWITNYRIGINGIYEKA